MSNDSISYTFMDSPLGRLMVAWSGAGLTSIVFEKGQAMVQPEASWHYQEGASGEAMDQLQAYFDGTRQAFDLALAPEGTPFQREVWEALQHIPYGETVSYAQLAQRIGRPQAVRAVGAANGKNPLPIVIPCHRVIGSDGTLTGYAGGVHIKAALLDHERRCYAKPGAQLSLL